MKKTLLTVLASVVGTIVVLALSLVAYFYLATSRIDEYSGVFRDYYAKVDAKDYAGGERILVEALSNPSFSDPLTQFNLHAGLADLHGRLTKNQAAAEKHYLAALAIEPDGDSLGLRASKAAQHFQFGAMLDESGRYDEAVKHFQESLAIAKEMNSPDYEAEIFLALGIAHVHLKDFDRGEYYLEETRKHAEAQDPANPYWKALVYNNLAWMYQRSARYDKALILAKQGLGIAELLGNKHLKALLYDTTAQVLLAQARYDEALSYSEKGMSPLPDSDYGSAVNFRTHGSILLSLNRKPEACKSFARAVEFYAKAGNEKERSAVLGEIAAQGC